MTLIILWIGMKFWTDIHVPQRMTLTGFSCSAIMDLSDMSWQLLEFIVMKFGDPLTFPLVPPMGQSFDLSFGIKHLLAQNLA